MACTRAVAVMLGTFLALTLVETAMGGVVDANVYSSRTAASQSQVTESDGTIKGVCAYLDAQGQNVKITYTQYPNGQIEAEADPPLQDTTGALRECRRQAEEVASQIVQRTQEQIFRQTQELQQKIYNQNRAIQQSLQFPPYFGLPQVFPFGH